MVIERLVFKARFGQGDTVVAAFKEFATRLSGRFGLCPARLLVDATGPMFTVVSEYEHADMSAVAQAQEHMQQLFAEREFQDWFAGWMPAVESGSRELFHCID